MDGLGFDLRPGFNVTLLGLALRFRLRLNRSGGRAYSRAAFNPPLLPTAREYARPTAIKLSVGRQDHGDQDYWAGAAKTVMILPPSFCPSSMSGADVVRNWPESAKRGKGRIMGAE